MITIGNSIQDLARELYHKALDGNADARKNLADMHKKFYPDHKKFVGREDDNVVLYSMLLNLTPYQLK